jgi:anti-anti-sigma factor
MLANVPDRDSNRGRVNGGPATPVRIAVEVLVDGTHLVSVWGEVDLATAPELERVLGDVEASDRDVLVELSRESFIDSTGLNVLIQSARRLQERGRSLRVTTENAHTRRVIETMGLTEKLGLVAASALEPPG